jgi:phage/plasmid-like protein (TIGR03299 family)
MAYVESRGIPWHGLGTPVQGLMTAEEAIVAGGLDWTVATQPIYLGDGSEVPHQYAVVRDTDGKVMGVVGKKWQPFQQRKVFTFGDALVADGGNHYDTVGSLDDGRTVFLSIVLSAVDPIRVNGDSTDWTTYLLLRNDHAGRASLSGCITPVRGVCNNTVNLAFAGAKQTFNIRHTGDPESKIEAARNALGLSIDYMRRFEIVANALTAIKVTDNRAEKIFRDVFAMTSTTEAQAADSAWVTKHHATKVMDLYTTTPDLDPIRGTGWGVVQAVADYVDHDVQYGKGKTTGRDALDVKMTSILWGNGADQLNRTVALIDPKTAALMDPRVRKGAARIAQRVKVKI